MFGLSFQKIAVFIAIVGALWAAMRVIRTLDRARRGQTRTAARKGGTAVTQDMKECPVCGTYVAPAATRDCGRSRCPYPA
ncbi:MAG: hypothetical protein EXQ94_11440 [Alphaproteobacteria bacterium]|nr:hypothetical protein [Alphaproteobacteria bacterium]